MDYEHDLVDLYVEALILESHLQEMIEAAEAMRGPVNLDEMEEYYRSQGIV